MRIHNCNNPILSNERARVFGLNRYILVASDLPFKHPVVARKKSERRVLKMAEENGTGNNLIWAVTLIIVVALIAGALYYSGFLGGTKKQQIDVEVSAPGR